MQLSEITRARKTSSRDVAASLSALNVPLLAELAPSEKAQVLSESRLLPFERQTCLCAAGDRADHLFLVLKGRVKYSRITEQGDEILLRLFTPGECFGLAALLPNPPNYLGTAMATHSGELLVWDHRSITQLCDRFHRIVINGLSIALRLLGTLSDRHSSLFEGNASHRIARALIDVGRRSGGIGAEGIDVHITNEQLGSLADVSKFTTSRVLSNWSRTGVITKGRETVRIHSPEALLSD